MANKADISRQDWSDHPVKDRAGAQVRSAGNALTPFGMEYECSAVVHFYRKPGTHQYAFIAQDTGLNAIPEGQADVGLKEMKRHMMGVYGREAPKERS